MSRQNMHDAAADAIRRFNAGESPYATLVKELEHVLDSAYAEGDPAADELNTLWVDLEIINATNESGEFSTRDLQQIEVLLERYVAVLADR